MAADVARELDPTVGDERDAGTSRRARAFSDGRDLRNARAAHHARRTNRTRPDTDLDAIGAQVDQIARSLKRSHVAGDHIYLRQLALDQPHRLHDTFAVPMRGIDHDDIHLARHQLLGALEKVASGSNRRAHSQAALGDLLLR